MPDRMNLTAGTLVFDGDCGFCMRALGWLRVLDRDSRITTVPAQRPDAPTLVDATAEQCRASVRWKGADGSTAAGAEAANAALSVALGTDLPMRLYRRTQNLQETCYEWISRNRGQLPGLTPWCRRYPGDCGRVS
ncbi:DCC1-like thiol-disulfide oxidoreductase family protein [Pseudonocardia hispaniensis]|uniref:DCC1-like thiol-disulfide oxidoreductase family protein n=1 Tax=Pseudonocardia hispaniensis TaxID=904933 RepID=A0ABW1J193_9PSEU